jgi:CheY-like chemotaxis protein
LSKLILVIEDEDDIASTLELALEMEGYQVKLAYHAKEAMEMLNSGPLPQLIISDVMMPVMDGYEFAEEIVKQPRFQSIPLIFTSAGAVEKSRLPLPYDFLRKPFSLDELLTAVKHALN